MCPVGVFSSQLVAIDATGTSGPGFFVDQCERVLIGLDGLVELGRVDMQVVQCCAVAIVVEHGAKLLQGLSLCCVDDQGCRYLFCRLVQVVTIGMSDCPEWESVVELLVDDQAGAGIARCINVGC